MGMSSPQTGAHSSSLYFHFWSYLALSRLACSHLPRALSGDQYSPGAPLVQPAPCPVPFGQCRCGLMVLVIPSTSWSCSCAGDRSLRAPCQPLCALCEPLSKVWDFQSMSWGLWLILLLPFPEPKAGLLAELALPVPVWSPAAFENPSSFCTRHLPSCSMATSPACPVLCGACPPTAPCKQPRAHPG